VINYFGQGALICTIRRRRPIRSMRWSALGAVPMVIIATMAAVTASQALISEPLS
jgi:K+ transporter